MLNDRGFRRIRIAAETAPATCFRYSPGVPGGHILVVDDDNVLRASIARILEEEGYTVDDAADGATALD